MIHGRFHPDEIAIATRLQVIPATEPDPGPTPGAAVHRSAAARRPAAEESPDGRTNLFDRLEARLAAGLRRRRGQPDIWYSWAA